MWPYLEGLNRTNRAKMKPPGGPDSMGLGVLIGQGW